MTLEKEDIMLDLIDRIAGHSDGPIVTEDLRKVATLKRFPTVFVIEKQDNVTGVSGSGANNIYTREAFVSVVSVIQGTTNEQAVTELRAFQKELRACVYKDQMRRIGQYGGGIREQLASQIQYPAIGNYAVAQEIVFKINYKEDVNRVFE